MDLMTPEVVEQGCGERSNPELIELPLELLDGVAGGQSSAAILD